MNTPDSTTDRFGYDDADGYDGDDGNVVAYDDYGSDSADQYGDDDIIDVVPIFEHARERPAAVSERLQDRSREGRAKRGASEVIESEQVVTRKATRRRPAYVAVEIERDLDGILAEIGPVAFVVWLALRAWCGQDADVCWPSTDSIARRCGISVSSARAAIDRLKTTKTAARIWVYPQRSEKGKQTSSDYWIRPPTPEELERNDHRERKRKRLKKGGSSTKSEH